MAKKNASEKTVHAFIAAVYPDFPDLVRLAYDEETILAFATNQLIYFRRRMKKAERERDIAREERDTFEAAWKAAADQAKKAIGQMAEERVARKKLEAQ
jgi:hypothetical protein